MHGWCVCIVYVCSVRVSVCCVCVHVSCMGGVLEREEEGLGFGVCLSMLCVSEVMCRGCVMPM